MKSKISIVKMNILVGQTDERLLNDVMTHHIADVTDIKIDEVKTFPAWLRIFLVSNDTYDLKSGIEIKNCDVTRTKSNEALTSKLCRVDVNVM